MSENHEVLHFGREIWSCKLHYFPRSNTSPQNHCIRHNLKPKSSKNKKRNECHLSSQDTPESTPKQFFSLLSNCAHNVWRLSHNDPKTWTSVIMTNGYKNVNGNIHMLRSEKVSLQYQAVMKHSIRHIICETAPPTLLGLLMHTTLPARTTTSNQHPVRTQLNPTRQGIQKKVTVGLPEISNILLMWHLKAENLAA